MEVDSSKVNHTSKVAVSTYYACMLFILGIIFSGCNDNRGRDIEKCSTLMNDARVSLKDNKFSDAVAQYTDACEIAENGELDEEWFQAQMGLARCYYRMGNNPEAYFLLSQAYEFAKTKLDERWRYFALGNMALIDNEQGEWDIAKKYFSEISRWAEKEKDSVLQSTVLGNLAELYGKTHDYNNALDYADRAFALIPQDKPNARAKLLAVKTTILCDSGDYPLAALTCDSLEDLGSSDMETLERSKLLRARILLGTGSSAASTDTASSLLLSADPLMLIEVRNFLAVKAEKEGNYKLSLEHVRAAAELRDSLADVKLGATNKANVARLDLLKTRATIEGKERVIVWESIAIVMISVFAFAGLLFGRRLILNHRASREQAERERHDTELQLQDSIKAGESLKNEIDSKNRTLASKMMHTTRRSEIIEDFMKFLNKSRSETSDSDYKRRLMQFKAELKNSEELENSMTYFENVNSGFLTRLRKKHPELNPNDIRFLCYVYMQLNTKEIASLLNIAESSCKKRKQRLAAKMNLGNASELYTYISGI